MKGMDWYLDGLHVAKHVDIVVDMHVMTLVDGNNRAATCFCQLVALLHIVQEVHPGQIRF